MAKARVMTSSRPHFAGRASLVRLPVETLVQIGTEIGGCDKRLGHYRGRRDDLSRLSHSYRRFRDIFQPILFQVITFHRESCLVKTPLIKLLDTFRKRRDLARIVKSLSVESETHLHSIYVRDWYH